MAVFPEKCPVKARLITFFFTFSIRILFLKVHNCTTAKACNEFAMKTFQVTGRSHLSVLFLKNLGRFLRSGSRIKLNELKTRS